MNDVLIHRPLSGPLLLLWPIPQQLNTLLTAFLAILNFWPTFNIITINVVKLLTKSSLDLDLHYGHFNKDHRHCPLPIAHCPCPGHYFSGLSFYEARMEATNLLPSKL